MSRTTRNDNVKPTVPPAKSAAAPAGQDPGEPGRDPLEERVERLEKRLEETIEGIEGSAQVRAIDDSELDDPLRRAVDRANEKRDPQK